MVQGRWIQSSWRHPSGHEFQTSQSPRRGSAFGRSPFGRLPCRDASSGAFRCWLTSLPSEQILPRRLAPLWAGPLFPGSSPVSWVDVDWLWISLQTSALSYFRNGPFTLVGTRSGLFLNRFPMRCDGRSLAASFDCARPNHTNLPKCLELGSRPATRRLFRDR